MGNKAYRHRITGLVGELADSAAHQFRDVLEEVNASSQPGRRALAVTPASETAPIDEVPAESPTDTDSQEAE